MATSGSYDSTTTETLIINDAFSLINAHDAGETLPGDKYVYGRRVLNQLINFLSIHEGLWLREDVTVTLTAGTASYTMGVSQTIDTPKPMRILDARRVSNSIDIPIDVVSREDYLSIPNKTLQAATTMVYYDQRRDTGTLYVWPTGTSTETTIKLTTSRPIQDFDASANNPDVPREWVLLITNMLAQQLCKKYNGGKVPAMIEKDITVMLTALFQYDAETPALKLEL